MLRSRISRVTARAVPRFSLDKVRRFTAQPPAPGLWSMMHARFPVVVPTSEMFFPGCPASHEGDPVVSPPTTQVTTLPNGIRVASEDSHVFTSSLGVFLDAGSRYESPENRGVTHFIQKAAFKATLNRSHFLVVRELEKLGAVAVAATNRDHLVFAGDCLRENVPGLFNIMADAVLNPRLNEYDMEEICHSVNNESQLTITPEVMLSDALHRAAFGEGGLGGSYLCDPKQTGRITRDHIVNFMNQRFLPSNIVVAGHGVGHDALISAVSDGLGGMAKTTSPAATPAQYTGGDIRLAALDADSLSQVAVGFKGVSWDHPDLLACCVLQILLGGGDSFSAGGPGKGMLSRLFTNVLNKHSWVASATAFNVCYHDAGVFGVQGSAEPAKTSELVDLLTAEMIKLTDGITSDEVERAKKQTKTGILFNLEQRNVICDDIGRQILTFGKRLPTSQFLDGIDKVSAADLRRVAGEMIKTPVSFGAVGAVNNISYDRLSSKFR